MALARALSLKSLRGAIHLKSLRRCGASAAHLQPLMENIHPRLVLENLDTTWDYSSRMRLPDRRCAAPVLDTVGEVGQPSADSTKVSPHRMEMVPVKFAEPKVEGTFELPPRLRGPPYKVVSQAAPRKLWEQVPGEDWLEKQVRASALDIHEVLSTGFSQSSGTADWDVDNVDESREAIASWVEQLHRYGVAMLVNVEPREHEILDVVRKLFMAERGTVYGPSFTIKAVANPNNIAYNNKGLLGHTDQPYMEQPPAIQLFHCIKQASEGGESRFLDGFALARKIWEKDREAFDVLSSHQVLFHDLTPKWHLEAYHPIFELVSPRREDVNEMPALKRVNFNEQTRDSWRQYDPRDPSQSKQSLDRFYRALTILENLVWEDQELAIRLQPGEVIVSDNWRTFHNRSAFVGERHFEGVYIDWDVAAGIWRRSSRSRP